MQIYNDLFDTVTFTTIDLMNHFDVDKLCMMGDFNARTGGLDDFIVIVAGAKENSMR